MMTREEHPRSTERSILVEKYVKDNPELGNRTLARILHSKYPDKFASLEIARSAVRSMRGVSGVKNRKNIKKVALYIREEEVHDEEDWTVPFVIHEKKVGIIGDLQGIFADVDCVNIILDEFKDKGVNTILINGDLIDNYNISRFAGKKRNIKTFIQELDFTRAFLERLTKDFKVYYKFGNHELRFDNYVLKNAPELEGLINLQDRLRLTELGVVYIPHLHQINIGDLVVFHGHEKPGMFTPKKIGEAIIKWWQEYSGQLKVKVLVNHHHLMDKAVVRQIDGSFSEGYANGCLCKRMSYSPYGRMQQGAAIVENVDGVTRVDLIEI